MNISIATKTLKQQVTSSKIDKWGLSLILYFYFAVRNFKSVTQKKLSYRLPRGQGVDSSLKTIQKLT